MRMSKKQRTINHQPTTNSSIPLGPIPKLVGGWLYLVGSSGEFVPIHSLSKKRLVNLITALSDMRKKKYLRRRDKRYGNLNKGFTDEELVKFLKACRHTKAKIAFMMQAFLGLRVGEVVKVKAEDVDFCKNRIRIFTEKANTVDFLYLHRAIRGVLYDWVGKNQDEIAAHSGYIFYSENMAENREHISDNWLRKEFRDVCKLCGLDEWYAEADDDKHPFFKTHNRHRKLHRLTTHSLRHYFITKVYKRSNNMKHTQKLARHTDIQSTQVYIYTNPEELENTLREVFEKPLTTTKQYIS